MYDFQINLLNLGSLEYINCERIFADIEAPRILNCPSDQLIEINFGQSEFALPWTIPKATDNSEQDPTVTCSVESASQLEVGTTEVACQAFDSAGNQAKCLFTVEIKGKEIDYNKHFFY